MASDTLAIPAPELSFVRSMADTDGKWVLHGDYSIWSSAQKPDGPPYRLHEWREDGVVPIPPATSHPILHRIAAGTPFEVAHLFGYWIAVDVDTVWIDAAGDGGQHYALIVGGTQGKPGEASCLWVCPKCATLFARESFAIPRQRLERFLDFAQTRLRAFNADPQRRTCPRCAAVHPASYGFDTTLDSAEERQARLAP
jgi:hypothetical protein